MGGNWLYDLESYALMKASSMILMTFRRLSSSTRVYRDHDSWCINIHFVRGFTLKFNDIFDAVEYLFFVKNSPYVVCTNGLYLVEICHNVPRGRCNERQQNLLKITKLPPIFHLRKNYWKNLLIWQNWSFENEIGFRSLIMCRERWKLNPTASLLHLSYNGYLELIMQIK